MSDIITSGALHSELALAAYATLTSTMSRKDIINNLQKTDMTLAQATAFADKYTVVEQFNGVKGGSMTVFEDKVSHQRILSVRGTDGPKDWLNDIVYALSGYNLQLSELRDKVQEWMTPQTGVLSSNFEIDGHSAGGFTAIALTQLFPNNITHAYVFNSPGTGGIWGNLATKLEIN